LPSCPYVALLLLSTRSTIALQFKSGCDLSHPVSIVMTYAPLAAIAPDASTTLFVLLS
jgi:hypothetical protein